MKNSFIDGSTLRSMLICGAKGISENASEINELNVFPVPDGDTGTNMSMTFDAGLSKIADAKGDSVGEIISEFARGMLLGARGNSGVILSQIFAGIAEGLAGSDVITAPSLAQAYRMGVKKSYGAVMNPTEGTILTVFRESTEYAATGIDEDSTPLDFLRLHTEEARRSLARTTDILPVLKEAEVVDSGGAGYLYIALGMYAALSGEEVNISYTPSLGNSTAAHLDIDSFTRESVLEYGYCTELLIRLMSDRVDPDSFDTDVISSALSDMGADSTVIFKDGDAVKLHTHTRTPSDVLALCQRYGEFLTVKIENMSISHTESVKEKKKANKYYSVVAVASGEGITSLLYDMGADAVICGGQTCNPSSEEFIEAFEKCESEYIVVFPNNKNVYLAAKQAADMWDSERVRVVATASIPECYSALSVMTPAVTDIDMLTDGAVRAAGGVVSGEVTRAVREVTIDGENIRCGDFIAISGGKIRACEENAEDALIQMLEGIEDIDEREIITLFVGRSVGEDARVALTERIEELYPDLEITVYEGGQDVYDYYVGVE